MREPPSDPAHRHALPDASLGRLQGRDRFKNKRIIVFGAGQDKRGVEGDAPIGNGRAASLLLAREGAKVFAVDRFLPEAQETADCILEEGGAAVAFKADLIDEKQVADAVYAAFFEMGEIDGLLVNIGVGIGEPWLENIDVDLWDRVFNVNVRAPALICKHAMPLLADGASIVFVSSVAALHPGSRIPAYDSSKAALDGLVRHVAWEGEGRRIRANCVAPGYIDTPNGRRATQHRPERAEQRLPFSRQGTGFEVANACAFLLSEESAYINAQQIVVDGGFDALTAGLNLPGQPRSEKLDFNGSA